MKRKLAALLLYTFAAAAHAAVIALPGSSPQHAPALVPFANPIAVKVTDDAGAPLAGVDVQYRDGTGWTRAVDPGAPCDYEMGFGYYCYAKTDNDGVARLPRLAGLYAADLGPTVTAYRGPARFGTAVLALTVEPLQAPAKFFIVSGDGQTAVIGRPLASIVVRLEGAGGRPLVGARIWYEPMTVGPGGFAMPLNAEPAVYTDAAGLAVLPTFTTGWSTGNFSAKVRFLDPAARAYVERSIEYTATNEQGGLTLSLQDLWWAGPAESGWGISVVQHDSRLFNVFYVYDPFGNPTWYAQGGSFSGGMGGYFYSPVYSPRGSPWFAYDTSAFQVGKARGNGALDFRGTESGYAYLSLDWGTRFSHTQKSIVRQDFHRLGGSGVRGVGDMWWGGPTQNGWGMAILEQEGGLFIVWFTYDERCLPTWFVMPSGEWNDQQSYVGAIYRTRSSPWEGSSYDAAQLRVGAVGTFRLNFDGTQRATFQYQLDGRSGSLQLERQPF
ncbi:MAG: hypothetical protein ABIR98_12530 [Usitatibacter sp.]